MMTIELELVADTKGLVSESPVFDADKQRLYYCDSFEGLVHAYDLSDRSLTTVPLHDHIGSLGLCRSGRLVIALSRKVVLLEFASRRIETVWTGFDEPEPNRLNDGKVGPDGCFWVGSMDSRAPAEKQPTGCLYRIAPDGTAERKSGGYLVSNGLAWSPDGCTMYHSDSRRKLIEAWEFEPATGQLSRHRPVTVLGPDEGHPDGAACDEQGCYWSAAVYGGLLVRLPPAGGPVEKIRLPIPTPTMPCFAGEWLYLTSLRRNCDEQTLRSHPGLGGLYRMKAPAAGARIEKFSDC